MSKTKTITEMSTGELLIHRSRDDKRALAVKIFGYARNHRNSMDSERHCRYIAELADMPTESQEKEIRRLERKVAKLEKKLTTK
jgi:hypothetical protein